MHDLAHQRPVLPGCRWIDPIAADYAGGGQPWSIREKLGFDAPRLFWLTNIGVGQWRGRHAHRRSILGTFSLKGECRLTLDDGRDKQVVTLAETGPGLSIGPMVWHDLFDFSPGAVILVVASTLFDEAEYIRDYESFLREAATSPCLS